MKIRFLIEAKGKESLFMRILSPVKMCNFVLQ